MKVKHFLLVLAAGALSLTFLAGTCVNAAELTTTEQQIIQGPTSEPVKPKYDFKVGYVKAESGVNVRTTTSTKSKVVKKIKYCSKVNYAKIPDNDNWVAIKYKKKNGKIGYGFVKKKYITKKKPAKCYSKSSPKKYSAKYFRSAGVIHWNGWRWTWYSEHELSGGGLHIPGRHVTSDKFICDKDGYICLASSKLKKGTIVDTPFGRKGKIYDCGCAANTLDVYTSF